MKAHSFTKIPKHIAVIMDGNGRWAKKRMLPRVFGHRSGAKAVRRLLDATLEFGIAVVTLFAFSSENWNRPQDEVNNLLELLLDGLTNDLPEFMAKGIALRFIGRTDNFDINLQNKLIDVANTTVANKNLTLVIALDYGGRWDICNAAKLLAQDVLDNKITLTEITENIFHKYTAISDLPPPDLLLRTSGEQRISNFLLWQIAYTEIYFCEILWPDFDREALIAALIYYSKCERRFGAIKS